ncbi:hypothetical protein D3C77_781100 [compost metagenome]
MEQLSGVAPGVFGAIQGNVGAFEQIGRSRAVIGNQRHADTGGHLEALTIQEHGLGQ